MESDKQKEIKELEDKLKKLKQDEVKREVVKQDSYAIPVAILIAGVMIAISVFYSGTAGFNKNNNTGNNVAKVAKNTPPKNTSIENVKPVNSEDHIRGSIDAPIKIIEFSDFECPFCKKFHPTMQRVMEEYGKDGKVAWIYRHFPLDSIHPVKARNEAAASECAAELGGNEKFWEYADKIFEITPSNNKLDQSLLPKIAGDIGLNVSEFKECLSSGRYDKDVEDDLQDAIASGAQGTPYSILIDAKGNKYPISGAQPYAAVKSIIDIALKNN